MKAGKLNSFLKNGFIFFSVLWHLSALDARDEILGPVALMGGQGPAPYAAFIEQDGRVRRLSGLPQTGLTYRVGINSHGFGIIGGTSGVDAYAALVSPEGELTPVQGLIAPGEIYFVSINESGTGMIGGGHQASNVPFAAIVTPSGNVTPFVGLPNSGLIYGVSIEKQGNGIIGGIGPNDSAYAALTWPNGIIAPIAGLPTKGGIFWVDANDIGTKLIGGNDQTKVYAAFVRRDGALIPVPDLPKGILYSVSINNPGRGLIGGAASNLPYAAFIESNGNATTIQGLPATPGKIYNVVLNDTGTGLLAGFASQTPYGAFVSPNGGLRPLIGLPAGSGFLDGAALHESGVAIVGGVSDEVPFAALVAPNGTLSFLSGLPEKGEINSIAIAAFDNLVPRAIGPFDSLANTQFLLSETLTQHNLFHRNFCGCGDFIEGGSVWLAPFGSDVHQKRRKNIPNFSNQIGGCLLGFDYCCQPGVTIGGGFAYAFNDVRYSKHLGDAKIDHESVVIYASLNNTCFSLNLALWGGVYEVSNTRRSFTSIISKNKTKGWTLSPHIELSQPFALTECQNYGIEPYAMFDLANHWQSKYSEEGESGFNIALRKHCLSILRSEFGVRFYETINSDWGCFVLEEKIGYVNRSPLDSKRRKAAFIDSFSTFNVSTLSGSCLNNGVVAVHLEFNPDGVKSFYGSLEYQGEFGYEFQSHSIIATIGKNF